MNAQIEKVLLEKLRSLPRTRLAEVEDFVDFLKARETKGRPVADIEQGHISTASCILANLSMELGRSLTWDAEKGRVVGDDEANKRLARTYRGVWEHPTPENV